MLVALILACEIGFWVVLGSGLVARYLLGRRRLGAVLLALAPVVDLVLLTATVIDLSRGATRLRARARRRLHRILRRLRPQHDPLDRRALRPRFAGGPPPARPPRHGWRARHEWREFGKAVMGGELRPARGGDRDRRRPDRTQALTDWLLRLTLVLGIWSLWPITYTLWPAKPKPGGRVDSRPAWRHDAG